MVIQLQPETESRIQELAKELQLSPEQVISGAVGEWLEEQAKLATELAQARLELREGTVLSTPKVRERLARRVRSAA